MSEQFPCIKSFLRTLDSYPDATVAAAANEAADRIEALEAALKPFARLAELYRSYPETHQVTHSDADGDRDLMVADLRAAALPLPAVEGRAR